MSQNPNTAVEATVLCYRCPRPLEGALVATEDRRVHLRRVDEPGSLMQCLREEVIDLIVAHYRDLDLSAQQLVSIVAEAGPDVGVLFVGAPASEALPGQLLDEGNAWVWSEAADTPGLGARISKIALREAKRHAQQRSSRHLLSWTRSSKRGVEDLLHELRTPVSIIQGYVANLLDELDGPLSSAQRDTLDRVQAATELLVGLAGNLRERLPSAEPPGGLTAEARRGGRRQLDVAKLCKETAAIFEPQAHEKGLLFEARIDKRVPHIWGDRSRLQQMLVNLLGNAVRMTPRGGAVSLGAEPARLRGRPGCRLRVRDTGPGVTPEARDRVFERGWSMDPSRAGLGLAICREITAEHQGDLRLSDTEGIGACFDVRLPTDARRRPIAVRLVEDLELAHQILLKLCAEQAPPRRLEPEERDVDELVTRVLDGAATLVVAVADQPGFQRVLSNLTRAP